MNHLGTMYATKRRRRNSKSVRVPPKDGQTKSNPSKRHRERLNAELDTLASLLPYEQSVLSKLDKLSILRLSVSYLRTKSYFQCALQREKEGVTSSEHSHKARDLFYPETLMEGDLILQALNGFLLILTCEGEVFYASHTVETYLGFHQSDICHQSVYELVHSEDREELQRHLMWNSHLPTDRSGISLREGLLPENSNILERNFTVRFRCLLDNTSGFLRLDIRGRIKVLQGQNHKTEEPPMALFAVCTPFGPPSLLEMPQKDSMFKSKHKLDLTLVSMDQRGKHLLGYTDSEMTNRGGYDLVHFDDLAYVASAHQELLKTGASGLIAYRLVTKDNKWQWLQTSARLVYKNSKPDFILCTHRPLIEEEGRDLLGKRTMDFKVTYLDGGLGAVNERSTIAKWEEEGRDLLGKRTMDFKVTYLDGGLGAVTDRSGLLSDSDFIMRCQRNRRYKTQIRDILTCRNKRPKTTGSEAYLEDNAPATPYNSVYTYTAENINGLAPYAAAAAAAAVPQNIFTAIDNTRFLSPDFLHYRHLATGAYYPDYGHHAAPQYSGNGFLDITSAAARTCFTTYPAETGHQLKDDKLYSCQLDSASKFNGDTSRLLPQLAPPPPPQIKPSCCEAYDPGASLRSCLMSATSTGIQPLLPTLEHRVEVPKISDALTCRNLNFGHHFQSVATSSPTPSNNGGGVECAVAKPKSSNHHNHNQHSHQILLSHRAGGDANKDDKSNILNNMRVTSSSCGDAAFTNNDTVTRQSVLMWGNSLSRSNSANSIGGGGGQQQPKYAGSTPPNSNSPTSRGGHEVNPMTSSNSPTHKVELTPGGGGAESNAIVVSCKWGGGNNATTPKSHSPQSSTSPASGKVAPSVSYNATYASEAINEGWHPIEPITTWRPHLPLLG